MDFNKGSGGGGGSFSCGRDRNRKSLQEVSQTRQSFFDAEVMEHAASPCPFIQGQTEVTAKQNGFF